MRHPLGFAIFVCVLTVTVIAGLVLDPAQITLEKVWVVLTGQSTRPIAQLIVDSVRLPRTITTCLTGMALRVAGLVMQTLFRNPLVDPSIPDIPAGSSLGVTAVVLVVGGGGAAALIAGFGFGGDLTVVVTSVAGSGTVMVVVLFMGHAVCSSITLLSIGVIIGCLVSAGVSIMTSFSTPQLIAIYS